ncbi:hypothetical protein [Absidia glauca]|uniref:RNA-dependent RNA polymerase n=1 Tax=Absidia glauca TaxID=4829 RepID=A0A163KBM8_ABSGL|nr:hypothetical protein [Absidia glauca]
MAKLDQKLIDNAKQVYIHLGLFSKQHSLTTTELDKQPVEIQKMYLLYCTDPAELTKVVRQFLQTSQRARQKSTLNDFIQAVDGALSSICAGADDDWDDDDLDGADRDDATPTTPPSTSGKANPDSSDTPLTDDAEYLKLPYQLQLQKDNIKFKGFNVIASPPDPLAIVEQAPMIFQVELARFMTSCRIPWHHLDSDTAQKFLDLARNNPAKVHDVMMAWYSDFRSSGTSRVPLNDRLWNLLSLERCSESVWNYGMDSTFSNSDTPRGDIMAGGKMVLTKSLRFTAKIHLPDNKDELPTIQLNIPRVQSSNRFFRKFGAERFLELLLSKVLAPEAISEHTEFILRPFLLMGRTYRFLFIKDSRMVLFATEGPGLTPISLHSVINWHIPIIENWSLTTCKFASRMSLGYSNSISTLQFEPENVRYIDDVFAPGRPRDDNSCMTDGCGIISASAMRKIMGSQQNDILPCAIQGRIGGAKGLWIVSLDLDMDSGDWIEIRSSQKKFMTGLPDHMLANKLDPIHFTFDLVKNAFCTYPSHLNTQFIQCLAAGGVPIQVFIELLTEHIGNDLDILTDFKNTEVLRDWLVRSGGVQGLRRTAEGLGKNGQGRQAAPPQPTVVDNDHDDRGKSGGAADDLETSGATSQQSGVSPINLYSGFPSNLYDSIVRLLDAGFDLTNAYIANRTTLAFQLRFDRSEMWTPWLYSSGGMVKACDVERSSSD